MATLKDHYAAIIMYHNGEEYVTRVIDDAYTIEGPDQVELRARKVGYTDFHSLDQDINVARGLAHMAERAVKVEKELKSALDSNKRLYRDIRVWEERHDVLSDRLAKAEKELTKLKRERAEDAKTLTDMAKENATLKNEYQADLKSIVSLNEKLNEYENAISDLKTSLAKAEDIRLCPHNDDVIEATKTELEKLKLSLKMLNEAYNGEN